MKKLVWILSGMLLFLATGCIDIIEEITLRKDGTGIFAYTIDLDRAMEFGIFEQLRAMNEEGDSEGPIEIDSMSNVYAGLSKEQKASMDKPEFWKKVDTKIQISEAKKKGKISFILKFDNFSEIDYFYTHLSEIQGDDASANPLGGFLGTSSKNFKGLYALNKRKITRFKQDVDVQDLGEEGSADMYKMMMSGAKYKTIYHLPGKVKKASHPNARISDDGKTVSVEVDLIERMEGKASLENVISFKKK